MNHIKEIFITSFLAIFFMKLCTAPPVPHTPATPPMLVCKQGGGTFKYVGTRNIEECLSTPRSSEIQFFRTATKSISSSCKEKYRLAGVAFPHRSFTPKTYIEALFLYGVYDPKISGRDEIFLGASYYKGNTSACLVDTSPCKRAILHKSYDIEKLPCDPHPCVRNIEYGLYIAVDHHNIDNCSYGLAPVNKRKMFLCYYNSTPPAPPG